MNHHAVCCTALLLALAMRASGEPPRPWEAANRRAIAEWDRTNAVARQGGPDTWTRPGLTADRRTRTVELLAEACGLAAEATTEFLLIGPNSDKAYEALAMTVAKPGDVARALEFIGLPRGRNADTAASHFWPKGERVNLTLSVFTNAAAARPLEDWVLDRRTGQPLAHTGFVYTGSRWTGEVARAVCLADELQPQSILATYNEPTSVLDVPRLAAQGDVYETFVQHPARVLAAGTLVRVCLQPEPRTGAAPRVRDLQLVAQPRPGGTPDINGVLLTLTDGGAQPLLTQATPTATLDCFAKLVKEGFDPYVTWMCATNLTVGAAHALAQALQLVEGESGIRMEAPPPGQLYYRAFLPNEAWRERAGRVSQPWELRLLRRDGDWHAVLVQIAEDWSDPNSLDARLTPTDYPLATWSELPARLQALGGGLPVVLVFTPPDAPLEAFLPAVRLLRKTHPVFHVFMDRPAKTP